MGTKPALEKKRIQEDIVYDDDGISEFVGGSQKAEVLNLVGEKNLQHCHEKHDRRGSQISQAGGLHPGH
jgi:hypothetical protein